MKRAYRAVEWVETSLVAKIFSVCFAGTHLPLLALLVYLMTGRSNDGGALFVVVLVATLVSTAFCLLTLWHLIRPLTNVVDIIQAYRSSGEVVALKTERRDEVGILTQQVSKLIGELDCSLQQLRYQASTDALTGLGNRRWFNELGELEIERARREGTPLCLILFDLDHFKQINDQHGHDFGDTVLTTTALHLQNNLRPYDIAARIGGEEFAIILPRTEMETATVLAERLRGVFEAMPVPPLPGGVVTASFGVSASSVSATSLKSLFILADDCLYSAKKAGRNNVKTIARAGAQHSG